MASCKECIYEPKCFYRIMYGKGADKTGKPTLGKLQMCKSFKNKGNFIEVSDDEIIKYSKDKWLVINTESEFLGKAIKHCLDCLIKDARRDNNG